MPTGTQTQIPRDMFPNLTESLEFLVIKNRTTYEQTLPITLNIFKFEKTLLTGMGESLKKICRRHGVDMHFKGGRTLKNILVSPKDEEKITNKNCVIYSYSCGSIDCGEEYIGESGRSFGERYKEHLKAPSPIFQHQSSSGHATSIDNFKIIGREDNSLARTIKESIYIRVNNPTLNRNIGKYNLPHIWDNLLFNIPELKMK